MSASAARRLRLRILLVRCLLEIYMAGVLTALFVMERCI